MFKIIETSDSITGVLEKARPFPNPHPELEQYLTPVDVAHEMLVRARSVGNLQGSVADFGCGTGRLALGAAALGARVTGIDIDTDALVSARETAAILGLKVEWVHGAVENWQTPVDTVVMNPPFGAQRPGADRPFLLRALATAQNIWSLHLADSSEFIKRFVSRYGGEIEGQWKVDISLPNTMPHHYQQERKVEGILYHLRSVRLVCAN